MQLCSRFVLLCSTIFYSQVGLGVEGRGVVYGESGRLDSFDPYTSHEASAKRMADLLFDGLVYIAPGGTYEPRLAQSWTPGKGGTYVDITLRKKVYWHTNDLKRKVEFTSEDVAKTISLITDPRSEIPNKERFNSISSVDAVGRHKVRVRFKRAVRDPMKHLLFKVLPSHVLADSSYLKRGGRFSQHPVGTGPYRFVDANEQGEVVLEANELYFGGKPKISRFVMKSYADQGIMAKSLMFNSLDLVTYVSPRSLKELAGDNRLTLVPYDALSFTFFAMNCDREPLRDKRVRQAISYAVNRQEMLKAFFNDKGQVISGPFPPTSWAYNLDVEPYEFSLEKAKSLLEQAGYKDRDGDGVLETSDGAKLQLEFAVPLAAEGELVKRIVLAFRQYLMAAGVHVELQFMDWLVWKQRVLGERRYDMTIASWSFDDASNITSLFHSSSSKPWGNNFVQYSNPEVDSLLTEADATSDFDKRQAIYKKVHSVLAADAPYAYLWTLTHHAAHSAKLSKVRVEPFSFFKYVNLWKFKG